MYDEEAYDYECEFHEVDINVDRDILSSKDFQDFIQPYVLLDEDENEIEFEDYEIKELLEIYKEEARIEEIMYKHHHFYD